MQIGGVVVHVEATRSDGFATNSPAFPTPLANTNNWPNNLNWIQLGSFSSILKNALLLEQIFDWTGSRNSTHIASNCFSKLNPELQMVRMEV